jgi:hypothetical protein
MNSNCEKKIMLLKNLELTLDHVIWTFQSILALHFISFSLLLIHGLVVQEFCAK